jgi:DNA repair ATPase RecN
MKYTIIIFLFILLLLLIAFVPYQNLERFGEIGSNSNYENATKDPGSGNNFGGVPKTCTVKELEDCDSKVKELKDLLNKKDTTNTELSTNSSKACDARINQFRIESDARIKFAEDKMNDSIKESKDSLNKLNDCNNAKSSCESKLFSAEYKLQPYIDALDKESTRASKCMQERNQMSTEYENMKSSYTTLQKKYSESISQVPNLQAALKSARDQITELTTNYANLKQKCIKQVGER